MSNSRNSRKSKSKFNPRGMVPTTVLGKMIRAAGHTRKTLAKVVKTTPYSVSAWSSFGVPTAHVAKVAKALGVPESDVPVYNNAKRAKKVPVRATPMSATPAKGSLIDQIKALEQAFAARLAALDEERAALNAKFATDRGALVAALAKEIEVYRQYLGPLDVTVPVEQDCPCKTWDRPCDDCRRKTEQANTQTTNGEG